MGLMAKKEEKKYTYGDYLTWPDDERWEIIDGSAYDMSPSPSRRHQEISMTLSTQFSLYLKDKPCKVYAAPFDVRLPAGSEKDEDIQTVVQPDIVIVCESYKLDDRGCKGAPTMVIEIISPYTAGKDLKVKFNLYESAGVKEYWIVDPNNKTVIIYKLGEDIKYGRPDVYTEEDSIKVGIFEDLAIDLKEVFTS